MAENLAYIPRIYSGISNGGVWVYGYYGRRKGLFKRTYLSPSEAKESPFFKLYGCLYNWHTAIQVSPPGWHLPSDEEWIELEMYLGMSESEALKNQKRGVDTGIKLKSTQGWDKNCNGNNSSGFNALPAGYRGNKGNFYGKGNSANFWTSSKVSPYIAYERMLVWDKYNKDKSYIGGDICRACSTFEMGFSVRCIKD